MDHRSLTIKLTGASWRVNLAYVVPEAAWRVRVFWSSTGTDLRSTLRMSRFQDLQSALNAYVDLFLETSERMSSTVEDSLLRAFTHWSVGRPGIRPRSPAARSQLDREADRASLFRFELAQAFHETRCLAQASALDLTHRQLPPWMLPMADAIAAGRSLEALREALLDQITDEMLLKLRQS